MLFIIPPYSSADLTLDALWSHPVTPESVLGEVRRANLNGRLYPDPVDVERLECLEALAAELKVEPVLATATSLGGWHVIESE